jgi:biotin operon repressor
MLEWLFGKKKSVEKLEEDVQNSFSLVKDDIDKIGSWIKHLHKQDQGHQEDINSVKDDLSTIKRELESLKDVMSMADERVVKQLFKTPRAVLKQQRAVEAVQIPVQTPVQTGVLDSFSMMERALFAIMLNSDLKLSYDDLAVMLGKSRATIRGQVNAIKQKSEGMIEEIIEKNGKKRVFVPDEVKERMLKSVKVRVRNGKKDKKE